jgi:hypothetical protein
MPAELIKLNAVLFVFCWPDSRELILVFPNSLHSTKTWFLNQEGDSLD